MVESLIYRGGIMEIKKDFNLRKFAGEYILMPKNTSEEGYDRPISLNEVEALVWRNLEYCENCHDWYVRDEMIITEEEKSCKWCWEDKYGS